MYKSRSSRISKKSRKSRSSISSMNKSLKYADKGLKVLGSTTKKVVKKSIPIIEESSAIVYDNMSKVIDLGIKTAEKMKPKKKSNTRKRNYKIA